MNTSTRRNPNPGVVPQERGIELLKRAATPTSPPREPRVAPTPATGSEPGDAFNGVIGGREPSMPSTGGLFLNCPRCGLSIRPRRPWLAIEHCPRCLARARIPITLFSSTLPAAELYHPGCTPGEPTNAKARGTGDDLPYHPNQAALTT